MTLPQPTAFTGLAKGFDGECPCCRRKFTCSWIHWRDENEAAFPCAGIGPTHRRSIGAPSIVHSKNAAAPPEVTSWQASPLLRAKFVQESGDRSDRVRQVLLLGAARCPSRLEAVVAVRHPRHADRQRKFTAGEKEVRSWTIPVGATAPQAAGVIHSDFEKGFIRVEALLRSKTSKPTGAKRKFGQPANTASKARATSYATATFATFFSTRGQGVITSCLLSNSCVWTLLARFQVFWPFSMV